MHNKGEKAHDKTLRKALKFRGRKLQNLCLATGMGMLALGSCTSTTHNREEDDETNGTEMAYHADNDIAMTVRSLVDAIKVGESIDSLDYDFVGILTDGQGSPLYTNLQGLPGEWAVDVLDTRNVSIKNLDLGDLLPYDLEAYLLGCLRLGQQNKVELTTEDAFENDDTRVTVYDFGGGYLRFETRAAIAPNGLEGPFMTIILSSSLPKGVETQTAV